MRPMATTTRTTMDILTAIIILLLLIITIIITRVITMGAAGAAEDIGGDEAGTAIEADGMAVMVAGMGAITTKNRQPILCGGV